MARDPALLLPPGLSRTAARLALAALLVGCGSGTGGPGQGGAAEAELVGRVVAGPTCPVETVGSPCPPAPVEGATVELWHGSEVVARTRTAADGAFRLSAGPGDYDVHAASSGGYRSETSTPVTLRAGEQASVTLLLDSGIR